MMDIKPHDLLWVKDSSDFKATLPDWANCQWCPKLPVVVRRALSFQGWIPVGVRGIKRSQRAATWLQPGAIIRHITPESLISIDYLQHSPFISLPPLQAALSLTQQCWPWVWGITGSTGFTLATKLPTLHANSDLDLIIRAPLKPDQQALNRWWKYTQQLPCRIDTQLETPLGAIALSEWLQGRGVLMKTVIGPQQTRDPWLALN